MSDTGQPGELTHVDADGAARMVDVSSKAVTERTAVALARVVMQPDTVAKIRERSFAKGDVLQVARIAGIIGAKRTPDLIPLCHPLPLSSVEVGFGFLSDTTIEVRCTARVAWRTGVEMEAMVGASAAALTIYDMVKAIDRGVVIERIELLEKSGGRSGTWRRDEPGVEPEAPA
ncbi:MAG: cyclic pyranopterin monophosphate synthase MoaC [Planctomycetota bacterium]